MSIRNSKGEVFDSIGEMVAEGYSFELASSHGWNDTDHADFAVLLEHR